MTSWIYNWHASVQICIGSFANLHRRNRPVGSPSIYVETASHTLAATITDVDRLEGYSFGYLHKWHFTDFLGKDIRDVLTSLVALAMMTVLLLGAYRYWATRVRRKRT